MLTYVRIQNYKVLRDLELELKPLTVLTGPLGSGKSSILEAVALYTDCARIVGYLRRYENVYHGRGLEIRARRFRRYSDTELRDLAYTRGPIYVEVGVRLSEEASSALRRVLEVLAEVLTGFFSLQVTIPKPTGVTYGYGEDPEEHEIFVHVLSILSLEEGREPAIALLYSRYAECWGEYFGLSTRVVGEKIPNEFALVEDAPLTRLLAPLAETRKDLREALSRVLTELENIARIFVREYQRSLELTYTLYAEHNIASRYAPASDAIPEWVGPHGEYLVHFLTYMSDHLSEAWYIITKWLSREEFGLDVRAGWAGGGRLSASFQDLRSTLSKRLGIVLLSRGARQVLPILAQLAYMVAELRGGTLMIEEPEESLHPTAQEALMEIFAEAVKSGVQIIMTTHSPYILWMLPEVAREIGSENIAVYIIERDREKGAYLIPVELDEEGFIKDPSKYLFLKAEERFWRRAVERLRHTGVDPRAIICRSRA